jgi:hypothetical protein
MRSGRLFTVVTLSSFTLLWLTVLSTGEAHAGDMNVRWERIIGNQQTFDLVGVGTGQVTGAAPWETTRGHAQVNLNTGRLRFEVQGLVLSVGSAVDGTFTGLDIGTPAGVTEVKGTLVCDVDGSAGGGNSVLVDAPAVPLSMQGDAKFNGNVSPLPVACINEPDIAFLIRIVTPAEFGGLWIAVGAVRIP